MTATSRTWYIRRGAGRSRRPSGRTTRSTRRSWRSAARGSAAGGVDRPAASPGAARVAASPGAAGPAGARVFKLDTPLPAHVHSPVRAAARGGWTGPRRLRTGPTETLGVLESTPVLRPDAGAPKQAGAPVRVLPWGLERARPGPTDTFGGPWIHVSAPTCCRGPEEAGPRVRAPLAPAVVRHATERGGARSTASATTIEAMIYTTA